MKQLYILIIAILFTSSCKTDSDTPVDHQNIIPQESKDPYVRNTQKLLQGTWINLDQKGVSVVFENNTRIENIEGSPKGKTRYFEISDGCKSDIPGSNQLAKVKAKYISLQDIDMCFYIVNLDKDYMNLRVIGRGNTIRYKKAGSTGRSNTDKGKKQLKKES